MTALAIAVSYLILAPLLACALGAFMHIGTAADEGMQSLDGWRGADGDAPENAFNRPFHTTGDML